MSNFNKGKLMEQKVIEQAIQATNDKKVDTVSTNDKNTPQTLLGSLLSRFYNQEAKNK